MDNSMLTPETALERSEQFIAHISQYPDGYHGRGIVICAGGVDRFMQAWVAIKMLRHLGCTLPIQLWHLGPTEIDDSMRALLAPLQVECVDAYQIREEHPARILNGWEMKPYAILHCPFREVLLLDADTLAVVNPEPLFTSRLFQETGVLFWPDTGWMSPGHEIWDLCGVSYQEEPEFDGGQILVDKERCWGPLSLCLWYNEHSDFFYRYLYGDKETFHLAFRKLKVPYVHPYPSSEAVEGILFQREADGTLIFQHKKKWKYKADAEDDAGISVLIHGERCRAYRAELRSLWNGSIENMRKKEGRSMKKASASIVTPARPQAAENGSSSAMPLRPFVCPVYTHDRGDFRSVTHTNVLIYWPHGFGDWVHLSYILPWLNPTNRYWITRFGDDSTALMEGNPYITPLYLGVNSPHCNDGADFGCRHFGLTYDDIDGSEKTLQLPESIYRQCCRHRIDALLWSWYPEVYGSVSFPFHTKARHFLRNVVSDAAALSRDLHHPLTSTIDFSVPFWLHQWVESRLRNFANLGERKLCLITRGGYTSTHKNWGYLWREDLPAGHQREGQECRDFMRFLLQKDPNWTFLVMEDRMFSGDDTVRSCELHAYSYAEVFGTPAPMTIPYALVLKALVSIASLSVGVPAGPYHLSMAKTELPTVGLWLGHLPSWYDEPREGSIHLISRNLRDTGADSRVGSFESDGAIRYRMIQADTRILAGEQVFMAVEELIYR